MGDATATLMLVTAVAVGLLALLVTATMGGTLAVGRVRRYVARHRARSELRVRRSTPL
jgi:uncharacterized membrane-anchored protein